MTTTGEVIEALRQHPTDTAVMIDTGRAVFDVAIDFDDDPDVGPPGVYLSPAGDALLDAGPAPR